VCCFGNGLAKNNKAAQAGSHHRLAKGKGGFENVELAENGDLGRSAHNQGYHRPLLAPCKVLIVCPGNGPFAAAVALRSTLRIAGSLAWRCSEPENFRVLRLRIAAIVSERGRSQWAPALQAVRGRKRGTLLTATSQAAVHIRRELL